MKGAQMEAIYKQVSVALSTLPNFFSFHLLFWIAKERRGLLKY